MVYKIIATVPWSTQIVRGRRRLCEDGDEDEDGDDNHDDDDDDDDNDDNDERAFATRHPHEKRGVPASSWQQPPVATWYAEQCL